MCRKKIQLEEFLLGTSEKAKLGFFTSNIAMDLNFKGLFCSWRDYLELIGKCSVRILAKHM